ncbi:MAG: dephospho-CoA kinase [Hespellia sp.]|nr:dephospho-CoA kinase [Hespellia sp.]
MKIIGITGGVGSGKSEVLKHLQREYGAVVYQADEIAKQLQRKGTPCYERILSHFGRQILAADGELDRIKLAEIVFAKEEELAVLNRIVHPEVKSFLQQEIDRHKAAGTHYLIIEAALLLENDYDAICDEIWYIHTEKEIRRERLKASRGYEDGKIEAIVASQMSDEVFRQRCDVVIENSRDFFETKQQIGELLE